MGSEGSGSPDEPIVKVGEESGRNAPDGNGDAPGEDAPIAVELAGVSKRYAATTAVDDLDLRIREGEFFTLVGPSGCGKTTTLRLIAGFEAPTEGAVRFGGEDVSGVPPEDRDVGVVFQNYALFPHMTVGENIAYGLNFAEPPGGVSDEERVAELLELVDLAGMEDRDPDELSGGQQQRVAMARALAPGPDVLLLDEPMSALDAQLRERLRVQVKAIQKELGITTIYVTHDQEEALAVSDRVAVMRGGAPEQVATPREIYREPASRFVAEFVGDNNVFAGTVEEVDESGGDTTGSTGEENQENRRVSPVETKGSVGTVRVGEKTLRVRVPEGTEPGDSVTFCVRPENLRVVGEARDTGGSSGGSTDNDRIPNEMTATVHSAEFLGETTRVHLDWQGRELLVRTLDPLSGTVVVSFDPDDAHVIDVS